ncbi:response regulator [Hymenobacter sp. DG25B]|uniref:response regulator n=1 Tax=Hymenobacter sp. DG25B TaxID=1385664 RepID=UPI000ABADF1D|nr:response regulator [Hymenobacter sp. DG25B]
MKNRILIVDDSFYMRTMLKNMLTDAGYDVVGEAANGQQALEMAAATRPDLITLDVILPDNTGLDVLKGIRQEQPNVRIVMCSAVGQEVIVNEALESGAAAYIVKPFSEEKVLEIVGNMLQQASDEAATASDAPATDATDTASSDSSSETTPQA